MSNPQNLEAKRALFAFTEAQKGNKKQTDDKKFNYSAAVKELPSMIRMNGLRATMAYFYSKEKAHELIFKQIRKWFATEDPMVFLRSKFPEKEPDNAKAKNFMDILLKLSDDEYRIVQAETWTLANWMIRFVKEDSKPPKEGSTLNAEGNGNTQ